MMTAIFDTKPTAPAITRTPLGSFTSLNLCCVKIAEERLSLFRDLCIDRAMGDRLARVRINQNRGDRRASLA